MAVTAVLARFQRKVVVDDITGCWMWQGARTSANSHGKGGYGRFCWNNREVLAHRAAWQLFKGAIPAGLTIDHVVCDQPACVNPAHLAIATQRENILRGDGVFAQNARKRYCKRGHEFTPENTGKQKRGRYCRICRRADWRRFREKHK